MSTLMPWAGPGPMPRPVCGAAGRGEPQKGLGPWWWSGEYREEGGEGANAILDKFLKYGKKWNDEKTPQTKIRLVFYCVFLFVYQTVNVKVIPRSIRKLW